jgi:hypothetical protein
MLNARALVSWHIADCKNIIFVYLIFLFGYGLGVKANEQCLGLLALLGMAQQANCTAKKDYSGGNVPTSLYEPSVYDPGNNPSVCNVMSAQIQVFPHTAWKYNMYQL